MAPTIHTARLTLRPFAPGDVAAYAAIRAKPEVMRFLPGGEARTATAREDAERLVPAVAALWETDGYGPWAATDRATGALLGHAGLRWLPELGETEVLYLLDSAVWRRGLAREAAAAAVEFGFRTRHLTRIIGLAVPENVGSIRVLQRIGMVREAETQAFGLRVLRFATIDSAAKAV